MPKPIFVPEVFLLLPAVTDSKTVSESARVHYTFKNPEKTTRRVTEQRHWPLLSEPVLGLLILLSGSFLSGCGLQPQASPSPVSQAVVKTHSDARVALPPPDSAAAPPVVPFLKDIQEPGETQPPMDKGFALRLWVEQQSRLYRIAAPLLINNTELCPQHVRRMLGFTAKNKYSYTSDFISEAESLLDLGEELRVMNILPGSGAELAGLRQNDILLAVEIEPLPRGPNAEQDAAMLIASEMQGRPGLRLTVMRSDERMAFDVPLTTACAMAIDLGNTDRPCSYADGYRVMISRGMLNLVRSDDELAYALAREIARNVLMPAARPDISAAIARLHAIGPHRETADTVTDAQPLLPEAPRNLDTLALYMLARAGYTIDGYKAFWDRLNANALPIVARDAQECRSAAEYSVSDIDHAIKAIQEKQADGQPLVP